MMHPVTTRFLSRLKASDEAAWFELWRAFGPVVRAQLLKWGKGRIGVETAADLSQETLAELSGSIARFDPDRGVRFSTWLLAIAKHVLGDELDRRNALKRGSSRRAISLDDAWMGSDDAPPVDEQYEAAVFRAKVGAALSKAAAQCEFLDFSIYRMRVLENKGGKEVADALGISEPTVSRRAAKVRDVIRAMLHEVVQQYSFTDTERRELEGSGLSPRGEGGPALDAAFDSALADVYHAMTSDERGPEARPGTR